MKRRLIGLCMALAALANVNAQTQEELWIKNGERNIYGVLSRPENGAKKQPVAIISHGFKPQERNKAIEWIREFLK